MAKSSNQTPSPKKDTESVFMTSGKVDMEQLIGNMRVKKKAKGKLKKKAAKKTAPKNNKDQSQSN